MKNKLYLPALIVAAILVVHCPGKEEAKKPAVEQIQITPENAEQTADQILKEIDEL